MKKRYTVAAVCSAAGLLTLAAMQPFTAVGAAPAKSDVKHVLNALLAAGEMTAADDYNGDGKVNAKDLTLIKRDLIAAENADTGDLKKQTIPVADADVKLIGRTYYNKDVTWLVQSGSAIECTVTGTEASVTIAGDGCVYSDEKWRPRYGVYVDGELVKDVVMGEPEQTVKLFSGTTQRTATVKIIHLSEANNGAIGVKQFDVTSSAAKPIKATAKKDLTVEFIGDSITCAYGVEADTQYVNFETGTENFTLSYAYLTAELLNADYSAVSYSGHGIISGYSNDGSINTDSLVPPVYEQIAKLDDYTAKWDFEANPVDAIVINLGTNDDSYATKDLETRGAEYQKGYEAFLKQVRAKNPKAKIICTLGIMGCEELYPYIEASVEAVGDKSISCYQSPTQKAANGYGADWHPSPVTHQLNAYLLADKICTALGIPSQKIGIDLAADGEYGAEIDKESGANAWPYFSDWDKSLNLNIMSAGTSPESMYAYVRGLSLPAGGYELSFNVTPPAGIAIPYQVRSMTDHTKIYCSGETNADGTAETVLKAFKMDAAAENVEIVFFLGEIGSGNLTFRDVTLYKRS